MALNNATRLLPAVIDLVQQAGTCLAAEWKRPGGPRGAGDKAAIDLEIEIFLRPPASHAVGRRFLGRGNWVGPERAGVVLDGRPE